MLASDTSVQQILGGAILGLFGGVGATVLWEGIVKPYRERRNLARSLATEILTNRIRLQKTFSIRASTPKTLPFNLQLSTLVFESVAEKIAELPEEILPELIQLYNHFISVNAIKAHLKGNLDQRPGADASTVEILKKKYLKGLDGLDSNIQASISAADKLLPKLVRYARFTSEPWLKVLSDGTADS